MSRLLITGGRGMLGRELATVLAAAGHTVTVADLPECDVRDAALLERLVAAADVVVNCAAYTNVDGAEKDTTLAYAVNAEMPGTLGRLAARTGAYVLHISTDFVFDGAGERPYSETDTPAPLSVYGASKLAGEQALAASNCRHSIVRLQWTYGACGNNFVSKILARARQPGDLQVVADQVGSPTWTRDAAIALAALVRSAQTGLFHYAADGYASRCDVATFILRAAGLDRSVTPCPTAAFPSPARRPLNSRFCCAKFESTFPGLRRPWQTALAEYLREIPPDIKT